MLDEIAQQNTLKTIFLRDKKYQFFISTRDVASKHKIIWKLKFLWCNYQEPTKLFKKISYFKIHSFFCFTFSQLPHRCVISFWLLLSVTVSLFSQSHTENYLVHLINDYCAWLLMKKLLHIKFEHWIQDLILPKSLFW